jgi:hypothetical protein
VNTTDNCVPTHSVLSLWWYKFARSVIGDLLTSGSSLYQRDTYESRYAGPVIPEPSHRGDISDFRKWKLLSNQRETRKPQDLDLDISQIFASGVISDFHQMMEPV